MLDLFLKVGYARNELQAKEAAFIEDLKKLDALTLYQLAQNGDFAAATKLSYIDDDGKFLDRFKGTQLFEQALALEQEEVQAEMLDQQRREERKLTNKDDDNLYDRRSSIRLKKKLLELELARLENGMSGSPVAAVPAAPVPGQGAQGAGAPGDVPAEGVQDNSQGLGGGVAKSAAPLAPAELAILGALAAGGVGGAMKGEEHGTPLSGGVRGLLGTAGGGLAGGLLGSAAHGIMGGNGLLGAGLGAAFGARRGYLSATKKYDAPEEKMAFADELGRSLARQDAQKAAHAADLQKTAQVAGALLAKSAFDMGGALQMAKGLGTKALGFAAAHPSAASTAVGAGVGALGGAAAGGPGNRLGGALAGGALGAAAGHASQGIASQMGGVWKGNTTLGEAAGRYAGGLKDQASSIVDKIRQRVGGPTPAGASSGTPGVSPRAQTLAPITLPTGQPYVL
jgi:hypothetical protein